VSNSAFYSDRLGQTVPRVNEEISPSTWRGLATLIRARVLDGSLARAFPQHDCRDGSYITGTDEAMFLDSLEAHIPSVTGDPLDAGSPQDTVTALDIIDFVARHIDQPSRSSFHDFFGHPHLYFAADHDPGSPFGNEFAPGQAKFRSDIELLFARNGVAYTMGRDMRVHRVGPVEARPLISDFRPHTGDPQLDAKLSDAMSRFLSRVPADRRDALEKLWDAFERLKTLELGGQKKNSSAILLTKAAPEPFRARVEAEFAALTSIGNDFMIRHHEHDKHDLPNDAAVDYLFIRLATLVAFILRQTDRMKPRRWADGGML